MNQAQLCYYSYVITSYKTAFEVPSTYYQALHLDEMNNSTYLKDVFPLEFTQTDEFDTFIDEIHDAKATCPAEYKKTIYQLVFNIHDWQQSMIGCS